jgi:hypothetical protein
VKESVPRKGSLVVVRGFLREVQSFAGGILHYKKHEGIEHIEYPSTLVHPVVLVKGVCHLAPDSEKQIAEDTNRLNGLPQTMYFDDAAYSVLDSKTPTSGAYVFMEGDTLYKVLSLAGDNPCLLEVVWKALSNKSTRVGNNRWLREKEYSEAAYLALKPGGVDPRAAVEFAKEYPATFSVSSYLAQSKSPLNNQFKKKETIMNKILANNTSAATIAAYNEAGRLANKQATKLVSKALPMMARGYADTAFGRLVVANAAVMGVEQFMPENTQAKILTQAMLTQAYQEVFQLVDIEGMLDQLVNDPKLGKVLAKMETPKKVVAKKTTPVAE